MNVITYDQALDIANTTIALRKSRVIGRDSDGNPCRVDYLEGAAKKAADIAVRAPSLEACADAISDVLTWNEIPVVVGDRTS